MSFKFLPSFCCKPSFVLVLFTLIPYIHSGPVPGIDTLYGQFIHNLSVKNCIPSSIKFPFINCTASPQCLSIAFKECNTPESIKPKEKTYLLCSEIFDNLNVILCQHDDKMFEDSKFDRALSTQVCEDFSRLKVIPKNEQYLGRRLVDSIVCNVVCSKNFEFLCQILLWSYEVQDLGQASGIKNLDQNKEHVSTNHLDSTVGIQSYRPENKQSNPSTYKQQQKDVAANTLGETKENVPKSLQLNNVGPEINAESKPKTMEKEDVVNSNSHPSLQQNDTIVSDHISSEVMKKDLTNTIPVNEHSAENQENSLQNHEEPEMEFPVRDDHVLNVKTIPKKIANPDIPETAIGEIAKPKNNEKNLKPVLGKEKIVKMPEQSDNELQTFSRTLTDDDDQEVQNKAEADNGQNPNVETKFNIDGGKISQVPENNSQFSLNKSKIKVVQDVIAQEVDKAGDNTIDSQISDTTGKGVLLNNIKNVNHQADFDIKSTNTAEDKVLTTSVHVKNQNISEQQNLLDLVPKQNIKDAEIDSNSLNLKTSDNDDKFNQESTSTETPLEKMVDSDIPQPPNQDQYNVYQRTKGNEVESKSTSVADMPSEVKNENSKTFDDFASKTSIVHGSEDIQMIPSFPEQEDSHFIFYFLSIVLILMVGYVIFHNKQKIIALIVEGRHERRRRSHGVGYKKLETK